MPRLTLSLVAYPLIGLFWLIMWALLIRSELRPDQSSLGAVTVEYVGKLLFHDDQGTDLRIRSGENNMGNLHLAPHAATTDGTRQMDFSGNLHIQAQDGSSRRLSWDGALKMDAKLDLDSLRLRFVLHEPGSLASDPAPMEITIDRTKKLFRYSWDLKGGMEETRDFTLDQAGLEQLLEFLGIDASLLPTGPVSGMGAPEVTARRSTLELPGGKEKTVLDTFLVSVVANGQTLLEAHVSEVGKILKIKTILDWTLDDSDMDSVDHQKQEQSPAARRDSSPNRKKLIK